MHQILTFGRFLYLRVTMPTKDSEASKISNRWTPSCYCQSSLLSKKATCTSLSKHQPMVSCFRPFSTWVTISKYYCRTKWYRRQSTWNQAYVMVPFLVPVPDSLYRLWDYPQDQRIDTISRCQVHRVPRSPGWSTHCNPRRTLPTQPYVFYNSSASRDISSCLCGISPPYSWRENTTHQSRPQTCSRTFQLCGYGRQRRGTTQCRDTHEAYKNLGTAGSWGTKYW